MKKALLFFCLIALTSGAKAQIDSTLANKLQNALNVRISSLSNRGISAHLIMPNGDIWNGTAGVGKQNIPITDTTLFHGASTTKLNIAILMMLLAQDGLVDLDASWHDYVSLNAGFDTLITIRQLLNHTSGIADYLETPVTGTNVTSDFNHFYTPQEILENVVSGVPTFSAGTNFNYSSSNYVLAALIAQTVTGHPVQTELRTRIWNPVGMRHTYFGAYDTYAEPTAGVWWNFGSGLTDYSNDPTTSMLSYGFGGANIVSCPTDLALLLNALLNNQLVNAQYLHEMLTFVPNSFSSWTAGYGLGIHQHHYGGLIRDTLIGHDGDYTNLTDMFHSKKYGFTLVTMTNTGTPWFGVFDGLYYILSSYFSTPTFIAEIEDNNDLKVYPNPATNRFNITSSRIMDEISIKSIFGQDLYKIKPDGKTSSLSIESDGIYFITITSGQQMITKKLIVQK